MDEEKKSNINSASIIDLKTELIRKQNEFKQQKLQNSSSDGYIKAKTTEKKPSIWSKKNSGVLQRAQKDIEQKVEEENEFEKSRKALQAKAAMYEKITQGGNIPEEDGSHMYLVDFQKKVIDNIMEKREKQRAEEEEKEANYEREYLKKVVAPIPSENEEWVDYTDSLGRSRRCMKKDLPSLIKQDKELTGKTEKNLKETEEMPTLMSHDMRREMLRQKWEKEEQEALNKPVGPTHYANVQFDEIRTHGVGYYQFSKDEGSRQEQLETLTGLRKQTLEERERKERLKEKRKAMLDARLAKVKQRKMMREGGGMFGSDVIKEEDKDNTGDADEIGPKLEEAVTVPAADTSENKKEPELLVRDETWKQNKPLREWDKGKEKIFSREDRYFAERREERCSEFAPPKFYYDATPNTKTMKKNSVPTSSDISSQLKEIRNISDKIPQTSKFEASGGDNVHVNTPTGKPSDTNLADIPFPETCVRSTSDHQSNVVEDINVPYESCQHLGSFTEPSFTSQSYNQYGFPLASNLQQSLGSNVNNLSGYQTMPTIIPDPTSNFQHPPSGYQHPPSGYQNPPSEYQHPPSGYPPSQYQQPPPVTTYNQPPQNSSCMSGANSQHFVPYINNITASGYPENTSQTSSVNTHVEQASERTAIPKSFKLNIIDPRFIQNQEILKSGAQNLSQKESDTKNQCSDTTDINVEHASSSVLQVSGIVDSVKQDVSSNAVFSSSPVVYKR